jgi:ribosomal protein S18 acetylase RimI-like enzyme
MIQDYKIVDVNIHNCHIIKNFLSLCKESLKTFRYFKTRKIEQAITNHEHTIVLQVDGQYLGYAHIDIECNNRWFGICVADNYIGKGIGKILMREILLRNRSKPLRLSVDSDNSSAIILYERSGFQRIELLENNSILMELKF